MMASDKMGNDRERIHSPRIMGLLIVFDNSKFVEKSMTNVMKDSRNAVVTTQAVI